METTNIEMVKALTNAEKIAIENFYNAWNTQQPNLLDEACFQDWKDIPLLPNQLDGTEGLKIIMKGFFEIFPDIKINIIEIFGSHERAGVRAEMTFTHDKEFLGIKPNYKKVVVPIHEFHHLKDGKITHTWHLEDWFGLMMQSKVQ
jgi:predicted ester cyclase